MAFLPFARSLGLRSKCEREGLEQCLDAPALVCGLPAAKAVSLVAVSKETVVFPLDREVVHALAVA